MLANFIKKVSENAILAHSCLVCGFLLSFYGPMQVSPLPVSGCIFILPHPFHKGKDLIMPRSEKVLGRTFLSYIGGGQDDVICVKKAETPTFAIFCLKYAQISGKFKDRNL
jgi:hypothetical protein